MQRVEVVGMTMQDRGVKPLRIVELALFVGMQRTPQHSRKIWLQGLRRPIAHPAPPPWSGMSPWFLRSCDMDLHAPAVAADSVNLLDEGRVGGCGADHRRHGERHGVGTLAERSAR